MRAIIALIGVLTGASCVDLDTPESPTTHVRTRGSEVEVHRQGLVTVDAAGTGCIAQGWTWAAATKTCKMAADLVNSGVDLTEDGVTLDCNYRTICQVTGTTCADPVADAGTDTYGILVYSTLYEPRRQDITVKNCTVKGFNHSGVWVNFADRVRIENLTTTGGSAYANAAPDLTWGPRLPKVALRAMNFTDSVFTNLDLSGASDAVIEYRYGNFSNSLTKNVRLRGVLSTGILLQNQGAGVGRNMVFEDIEAEAGDSRSAIAIGIIDKNDYSIVRRLYAHPKWEAAGARWNQGVYIGAGNIGAVVEDSTIVGAWGGGIIIPPSANTVSAAIRNNVVTGSGGGLVSGGMVTAQGNVFCNDPAGRYIHPTITTYKFADITLRHLSTGAVSGRVFGTDNTCGFVNVCPYVAGVPVCDDGGYRDLDAPSTSAQPCSRACP